MREKSSTGNFRDLVIRFAADDRGATAIEYALVAGIMVLVALTYRDVFTNLRDGFMQPTNEALGGV